MLFTFVHDTRLSFHVLTMTFSFTIFLLIFYLIFLAHKMKEDNDDPKTLYSGTNSI